MWRRQLAVPELNKDQYRNGQKEASSSDQRYRGMGFADRKQERQGAGPLRPGVDSHLDRGNEEQRQSIEQKPGWCNMSLLYT